MDPEPKNEDSNAEEKSVCPKCLTPNDPLRAFCSDCGAPIGMVSAVDPWQHIFAEGHAYRSAVDGPPKFIVLVGMWLIFGPFLLLPFAFLCGFGEGAYRVAGIMSVFSIFPAIILFRVTKNYIVKSRAMRNAPPAQEEG